MASKETPYKYQLFCIFLLFFGNILAQSDECATATTLTVSTSCVTTSGSTAGFSDSTFDSACTGDEDDDGWYQFVATSGATAIQVTGDVTSDMVLTALSDCSTEINCTDTGLTGETETLIISTLTGTTYYIHVFETLFGAGTFDICVFDFVSTNDCLDALVVCDGSAINFTPSGPGNDDFANSNNDPDCLISNENQSAWYYFEVSDNAPANLNLNFVIDPINGVDDYDFAVYGPDANCDSLGLPIRCSYADAMCAFCPQTGLGMGTTDLSEGALGDGFVASLLVNPSEGFYLLVDNFSTSTSGFDLNWSGTAAPWLDCNALPPCDLVVNAGSNQTACEGDVVNLSSTVTNGSGGQTYQWEGSGVSGTSYLNNTTASNPTVTLPSGFSGNITYTVTVTDGNCDNNDNVQISVQSAPNANSASLTECDEGTGTATFDLLSLNVAVGGLLPNVTYYSDAAGTMVISNPGTYISAGGTIYAGVDDGNCESEIVSITLNVTTPNCDDDCSLTIDSWDANTCLCINTPPTCDDGCPLTTDLYDAANCQCINLPPSCNDLCPLTTDTFDDVNCICVNTPPSCDDGCALTTDTWDNANCQCLNTEPTCDDGCALTTDSYNSILCQCENTPPNCDDGCPLTSDSFNTATCQCDNIEPTCDDGCPLTTDTYNSATCQCENTPPNCDDGCPLTADSWNAASCQCENSPPNCDDSCPLTTDSFDATNCLCVNADPSCDDGCSLTVDSFNSATCQCENTPPNCDDGCPLTADSWDNTNCQCVNDPPICNDGCPLTSDSFNSTSCQCEFTPPSCDDGCPLTTDSFDDVNCICVNDPPNCDDGCSLTTDSFNAGSCQCENTPPNCDDGCPLTADSFNTATCQCENLEPNCDDGCIATVDSYNSAACLCENTPPNCDDGCPLTADSWNAAACMCENFEPNCDDACPLTADSFNVATCQCENIEPNCDDGCPLTADSWNATNCICENVEPNCDDGCALTTDYFNFASCQCENTEPNCDDGCPLTIDSYNAAACLCENVEPNCDDGCPLTADSFNTTSCQCENTDPTCDDGCPLTVDIYDAINCLCLNNPPDCDDGCPLTADSWDGANCHCVNDPPNCDDGCPLTTDSFNSTTCLCENIEPSCDDGCPLTADSFNTSTCLCENSEPTCDDGCPLTNDNFDLANCVCENTPPNCDDGCSLTSDSWDTANCQCVNTDPTCDDGCPLTTDLYDAANCECLNTPPPCDDGCPLTSDSWDGANCQCIHTPPNCDDGCPLTADSWDDVNCQCLNVEPNCDDGCPLTSDFFDLTNCICVNDPPTCDDGCPLTTDVFDEINCICLNDPPNCDDGCSLTADSWDNANCQCVNAPPNCDDACPLTTDSFDDINCVCLNDPPNCDDACALTTDFYNSASCLCENIAPNCDDNCPLTADSYDDINCQCINTPPLCDDGCPLTTDNWNTTTCACEFIEPTCDDNCSATTDVYDAVNCQCINTPPSCNDACPLTTDVWDGVNCQCINTPPNCDDGCPLTSDSWNPATCSCLNIPPNCDDGCSLTTDSWNQTSCQCENIPPNCDDGCPATTEFWDLATCQCIISPPNCDDGCSLTVDTYDSSTCQCENTPPNCSDGCWLTIDTFDPVSCQCVNTPPNCDDGCPQTTDVWDLVNCQCINTPPNCDDGCPFTSDIWNTTTCVCENIPPSCNDGCPLTINVWNASTCQCETTYPDPDDGCPLTNDIFDFVACVIINDPPSCDDGCVFTIDSFDFANCQCVNTDPTCDDGCPQTTDVWDAANCLCINTPPPCDDGCPLTTDSWNTTNCVCEFLPPVCDDGCPLTIDTFNNVSCQCESTPPNCDDGCPLTTDIYNAISCTCENTPPNCDDGCPLTNDSWDGINCQCVNDPPNCDDGCPLTMDVFNTSTCICENTPPNCDDGCPLTMDSFNTTTCLCENTPPNCDDGCPLTSDTWNAVSCLCENTPPNCDDGCPLTTDIFNSTTCLCENTPPNCDDGCPLTTDVFNSATCLCENTPPNCDDGCPLTSDTWNAASCLCENTPPNCDDGCPLTADVFNNTTCLCESTPPNCDDNCPLTMDVFNSTTCLCENTPPNCDDGCPLTMDVFNASSCLCENTPPNCDDGCPLTTDVFNNATCQCESTPPNCDDGCPLTMDVFNAATCLCENTPPNCDDGCPLTMDVFNASSCLCENTPPNCDDGCPLTTDIFNSSTCQCENTPPNCDDGCPLTMDVFNAATCLCENTPPNCDDGCPLTTDVWNASSCLCENTPPNCDDNCPLTTDIFNSATCLCENTPPNCDDACPLTSDSFNAVTCLCENTPPNCDDGCPLTTDFWDAANCQCVNNPPNCDDGCPLTMDVFNNATCLCENTPPNCDDGCPLTSDSFNPATCLCENMPPNCDDGCPLTIDVWNATSCMCENTPPNCDDNCPLTTDIFNSATCLCENTPPNCDDGCPLTMDVWNLTACLCENTPPNCDDGCPLTTDVWNDTSCMCENTPPNCDDACPLTTDIWDAANCQCVNTPPDCDDNCPLTTDSWDVTNCQCENLPPNCDDNCPLTIDTWDATNCLCENMPPNCDDGCSLTIDTWNQANCQCESTPPNCDDGCPLTSDSWIPSTCMCVNVPPICDDACPLTTDTWNATLCQCEFAPPNCDDGCIYTLDSFNPVTCQCENLSTPPNCDDNNCATTDSYDAVNCQCDNTPILPPTASNASLTLCDEGSGTATFDLTSLGSIVNNGSGNTIIWMDGSGVITNPSAYNSPTTTITAEVVDNQTPVCQSANATISLIVQLNANAGTPDPSLSVCNDSSTPISLSDLLNGEDSGGTWTETSVIPSNGGFNAIGGIFTPLNQNNGTYTFEYLVAGVAPCTDVSSTVSVIINNLPSATLSTNNLTTCNTSAQGSIIDLQSLIIVGDTGGSWEDTNSTGVNFSNPSSVDFNGIEPGSYTFTYTTNSATAPCLEQSYLVDILVEDCSCPSVGTIPPPPLCNDVGSLDLTTLQTTSEPGTWSITSTPIGGNPATISGATFNASSSDAGIYEITFTLTNIPPPGCPNSSSQNLVVNLIPQIQNPGNQIACDFVVLPPITGNNLSGNEAYFTGPNGTGTQFQAGTNINFSTLLFIYDANGNCNDETQINIDISNTPTLFNPGDQNVCDAYILPPITGINLSGNEAYYTGVNGTGMQFQPGNVLNNSIQLFIYDANGNCNDETNFFVTINPTPDIINQGDQIACDAFILPPILGTNLSGNEAYYSLPNGNGITYPVGTEINTSTVFYLFDENGNCQDEEQITVIINESPFAGFSEPILQTCNASGIVISLSNLLSGENPGGLWTETSLVPSSAGAFNPFAGTFIPNGQNQGIYSFEYELFALPPCESATATVEIEIQEEPFAILSSNSQTVCNFSALGSILDFDILITGGDSNGNWADLNNAGVNLSNTTSIDFDGLAAGTYNFEYSTNSAILPCEEQNYNLQVIVEDCACPSIAISNPGNICNGNDFLDLTTLELTSEAGSWSITSSPNGSNPGFIIGNFFNATGADSGEYEITFTLNNTPPQGCEESATTILMVDALPQIDGLEDQILCSIYTLPTISGNQLSGNEAYYDMPNGSGNQYIPGDEITVNSMLYIYDSNNNCVAETSFEIIINESITNNIAATICEGEVYEINEVEYDATGNFSEIITGGSFDGCDSIINLDLNVLPLPNSDILFEFCVGEAIVVNSNTYSLPGIYSETIQNAATNGCDSLVNFEIIVNNPTFETIQASICDGNSYVLNGLDYSSSGIYSDTIFNGNENGCDSIITLDLTINSSVSNIIDASICEGQSYEVNGIPYFNEGTFQDTILNGASGGCDSIIILNLAVNQSITAGFSANICEDESYFLNGIPYTTTGYYQDTIYNGSVAGCDSILILELNVGEITINQIAENICSGSVFTLNGNSYGQTGIYQDTIFGGNAVGCDSILILDLTVNEAVENIFSEQICEGENYTLNNVNYSTSGIFNDTLFNAAFNGCDSILILNLTVNQEITNEINASICSGETYTLNGINYSNIGIYFDTLQNASISGCDSILVLDLSIDDVVINEITESICEGESYNLNNINYSNSGVYQDTLLGAAEGGCDSILILNLTVNQEAINQISANLCEGESYILNGNSYSQEGIFQDTIFNGNSNGCDSILVLNLSFSEINIENINANICEGETYSLNGIEYSQEGVFQDTLVTISGCDSIFILNLFVDSAIEGELNINICEGESYSLNGDEYSQSGIYFDTLNNASFNGCDSLIILNLEVNNAISSNFNQIICEGEVYTLNQINYSGSGIYNDTIFNGATGGCDSILILDLTVTDFVENNFEATICEGETIEINSMEYSTAGLHQEIIPNGAFNGCDSIINLDLEVNEIINHSIIAEICEGEEIEINGVNYSTTGLHQEILPAGAFNGCDSIINLNLTLNEISNNDFSATLCDGESIIINGVPYSSTGIFTETIQSGAFNGCDSIITLDLTVNNEVFNYLFEDICEGDSFLINGVPYSSSGIFTEIIPNGAIAGCDSVIVLNLTALNHSFHSISAEICNGDSYEINGVPYTTTGVFTEIVENSAINGCDSLIELSLSVINCALEVSLIGDALDCYNDEDGVIALTFPNPNGLLPYNYTWENLSNGMMDNGVILNNNPNQFIFNLEAGIYNLTITDNVGTAVFLTTEITEPPILSMDLEVVELIDCPGDENGSIAVEAFGGTPGYEYLWNTGQTTNIIENLSADNYSVTITDANGCEIVALIAINNPPPLAATINSVDPNCFDANGGSIQVSNVENGTSPYFYSFNNEPFSEVNQFNGLDGGQYELSIQDANGCQWDTSIIINLATELVLDLGDDLFIELGETVQLNPLFNIPLSAMDTMLWSLPDSIICEEDCLFPIIAPTQTITIQATLFDLNGCSIQDFITIFVNRDPNVYIPNAFSPNGDGTNDLLIIYADKDVKQIKAFQIFDRWGESVHSYFGFQPNNPAYGWNGTFRGKPQDPAVFVYYAEIEFVDGRTEIFEGDIILIR